MVFEPSDKKDYIEIRMDNLLRQVRTQMGNYPEKLPVGVIAPFDCGKVELKELAEYLEDITGEIILKGKWMKLVERKKLDEVLKEHKMELTGLIDTKSTSKLGKFLEASIILCGKMYYLGTDRVVHVRAVDIATSEIVAAARIRM